MHKIDESRPFFTDAEPEPMRHIRRQLEVVAPGGPEKQIEWLVSQLAEVGQVSAEKLMQKVLNNAMDKHWHRTQIRVNGYRRKR